MDIDEIKTNKKSLENKVKELMLDFEKETGVTTSVRITDIITDGSKCSISVCANVRTYV